jgi:tetratricopeptide (TPR) repeat protein
MLLAAALQRSPESMLLGRAILLSIVLTGWLLSPGNAQPAAKAPETICSDHNAAPEAALEACNKVIVSGRFAGTDLANIIFWRGYAYHRQAALDAAIADYTEAIRLDPTIKAPYEARAEVLVAIDQRDRALADLNEVIKLDPKNLQAHIKRGVLRYFSGDLDHAIEDLDAALALDPNNAAVYSNRGSTWRAKGDLDRAIADLVRAIALQPDYARAFYQRGLARERNGDTERAMKDYDEALRLEPGMIDALVQRAGLREAKSDSDGAKADLIAATSAPTKYLDDKQAQDTARERLAKMGATPKQQ